jgi:hypothetical protein
MIGTELFPECERPALGALLRDRSKVGGQVQARAPTVSAASSATSVGVVPTRTP